ncbi:hypothetical protein N9H39_04370 [Gammaproteobacteria bacterium]|nr:hypothetical protein [Gammaproteobacteria bacterium]
MGPTPGSLVIKKNKKDVSVNCQLAEYKDTTGVFESKFADATMGNILLGGVIGAAIDASSGASHEYDPIVTLTMIPLRFASQESRDIFFDKMSDDFVQGSNESIKLIAEKCKPQMCDYEKEEAEKAREARLAEIESERRIAMIGEAGKSDTNVGTVEVSKSAKELVATISPASQTPIVKELIGNWGGEISQCAACSPEQMKLQITAKDSHSYTGDVMKLDRTGCKGSEIKLNPGIGNLYSMTFQSDTQCDAEGTLEHSGQTLTGKIRFKRWPGVFTVNLSKLSTGY